MKIKITASIKTLAPAVPALDFKTGTPLLTKDGRPLYDIPVQSEEQKKIAGQTFTSQIVIKLRSEVEIKTPGDYNVELADYPMKDSNSNRIIHNYRLLSLLNTSSEKKAS